MGGFCREFKYKKFEKYKQKYELIHIQGTIESFNTKDQFFTDAMIKVDSPDGLEKVLVKLENFGMRDYSNISEEFREKYSREDDLKLKEYIELLVKEIKIKPDKKGGIEMPYTAYARIIATERSKQKGLCYLIEGTLTPFTLKKRKKSKDKEQSESGELVKI